MNPYRRLSEIAGPVARHLGAFIRDESGQDVVEYGLLFATVGISAVAAAPLIRTAIGVAFAAMNTGTQDQWIPPNPGA